MMIEQTIQITPQTTVNEAIKQVPEAVAVFKRVGIDACCGGALPIGDAAKRHKLNAEDLLNELRHLTNP
jgi:iron-sulfur cluster repair protein YtfE (RIC family)